MISQDYVLQYSALSPNIPKYEYLKPPALFEIKGTRRRFVDVLGLYKIQVLLRVEKQYHHIATTD